MKIIYAHGFNSSGESSKCKDLRSRFPNYNIVCPTLSPNPEEAYQQIREAIRTGIDSTIIAGTSLGGFYALLASVRFDVPCFLINPSLKPYQTLQSKVGKHIRYDTLNEEYDFKEEYLSILNSFSKLICPEDQSATIIHLYLSKDDELLNFSDIHNFIPRAKTIKHVENAGHRFSKFDLVMNDIEKVAQELEIEYPDVDYII